MGLSFDDIEAALALGPFEERSDFDLNPGMEPSGRQRPAAVLCGLVERSGTLHVLLTRRARHLTTHAGQISFPGGKIDQGDASPMAAALREADEEVGLTGAQVEVLGRLDTYRTRTGFRILPFVGRISPAFRPMPHDGEVEEVFETPLDFLMNPTNHARHSYKRDGQERWYYAMPWRDYYIWGATAGMLKNLSDRLEVVARERAV